MIVESSNRSAIVQWAVVGALVAVGAYLRLANLGALGFRWDEDLSGLAVQAILEKGVPELPSGMIYLRSGLFLYVMAASAELFGFSELTLRLPAAVCGIALIPVAFLFGRTLFDARIGLILAALVTVSYWDIELARYARMYAPFSLFYLLTVLCIWKYRVASTSFAGGGVCILLALFTVSLHQLGYTLALAFFYPLVIRGPSAWRSARNWIYPAVAGGLVAASFFYWTAVIARYRYIPATAAGADAEAAGAGGSGVLALLARALPEPEVLSAALDRAPLLAILLAGLSLGVAFAFVLKHKSPWLERALVALVAACCAVQLFNVALLGILALAFAKGTGLAAFRREDVLFAIAVFGLTLLGWMALAVGLDLDGEVGALTSLRASLRALLDYPHFFVFWGYPNEWPLLSIVAAIGGLWAFDRAASWQPGVAREHRAGPSSREASMFLLLALVVPLTMNGSFDTSFELFRYNVPFDTFYFAFAALALVHWREVLAALRSPAGGRLQIRRPVAVAGTAVLAILAISFDLNPLRGWLSVQRQYLNDGPLYRTFDVARYDDFKTTSEFVASRAASDDLIIAFDSREYFNYLGRLDYWVRSADYEGQTYTRDGTARDLYIDTPLIMTLDELRIALATPERTKWLLASASALARPDGPVSREIRQFLLAQRGHIVYVGRDGNRTVFRFE